MISTLKQRWRRNVQLQQCWREQRYVALDLETSGLDPRVDQVLAVGWIVVEPPLLDYGQARYAVVQQQPDLKQSPVVHGLLQRDFRAAEDAQFVLQHLAEVLENAVLVCHHVGFDWQFLSAFAKAHNVRLKPLAKFDTLTFEAQRLRMQQHHLARGSLKLAACRQRYGLPDYQAHQALTDAIACGELFLAQAYHYAGRANVSLRNLLSYN
ncbi:3'-5' exonuclease [Pseudidiomarina sediminum]|nr:3'-5' exonuclease [Pseudidiomarina sediminum]MBY6063615.1 3'-5' exonuclease [Pseudidiomarina sediminum]